MTEPIFCNINESALIAEINRATQRVVLVAPGVTKPVAEALGQAWERLGAHAVSVIFDVDAEVCRLGYGTLEGLEAIQDVAARMGQAVCHQPGVRICLLVSDSTTLVFSPTPLLVEAGSSQGKHPNAIRFDATPPQLEQDLGITAQGESTRIIGLDSVPRALLESVKSNLNNNPPVKFDLARVSGQSKPASKGRMKTSHFEGSIAYWAAWAALGRNERTQRELAAFDFNFGGQWLVQPADCA